MRRRGVEGGRSSWEAVVEPRQCSFNCRDVPVSRMHVRSKADERGGNSAPLWVQKRAIVRGDREAGVSWICGRRCGGCRYYGAGEGRMADCPGSGGNAGYWTSVGGDPGMVMMIRGKCVV
jgi:hypothetical protein